MKIELLKKEDFNIIYKMMENAFPKSEIRPYEKGLQVFDNCYYHVYIKRGLHGDIDAFIAAWEFEEFRFIEYFAVTKEKRGRHIGSKFLSEFLKMNNSPVILEVENIDTEIANKRIDFYKLLGFCLNDLSYYQPRVPNGYAAVPFCIMSYPERIPTERQEEIKNIIFKNVYNIKADCKY